MRNNPTAAETVMDIEDLGRLGRGGGPCPYYASRALADAAELVFMPYNYLARSATPAPPDGQEPAASRPAAPLQYLPLAAASSAQVACMQTPRSSLQYMARVTRAHPRTPTPRRMSVHRSHAPPHVRAWDRHPNPACAAAGGCADAGGAENAALAERGHHLR